ncbi:MAG: glycosyltransferase [Oligoflexia bacterium]|nr:glycosyltransferase [Oligoflexia bacterium]
MESKKNVLFVIPNLCGGGAERQVTYLVNGLDRTQFNIFLYLFENKGVFKENLKKDVHLLSTPDVVNSFFSRIPFVRQFIHIPFLIWWIRKHKIQVINSRMWMPAIIVYLSLLFLRRKEKIKFYPVDDCFPEKDLSLIQTRFTKGKRFLVKKAYQSSSKLVSISNEMTKSFCSFYSLSKNDIVTIYNGIDLTHFAFKSKAIKKNHPFRLLSVGRLNPQKGFDLLIQAVHDLAQKDCKISVTILGDGLERENLLKLKQECNLSDEMLLIRPFTSDIVKEFYEHDLYVLSSRYEGLVLILMEALASGIPIVATNCKSGPAEILDNGRCGLLVQSESPLAIAKGIVDAINDYPCFIERSKLGRKFVEDHFDINATIRKFESLFAQ